MTKDQTLLCWNKSRYLSLFNKKNQFVALEEVSVDCPDVI